MTPTPINTLTVGPAVDRGMPGFIEGKTCTKCRQVLPRELFSLDRGAKDGRYAHCKPCFRERYREWAEKNKQSVLAYQKEKYAANREQKLAVMKAWREKNKPRIKAENRVEYQQKRAQRDAVNARWRAENPDRCTEIAKRWRKANPQIVNAKAAHRRAAKRLAVPAWANPEAIASLYRSAASLSDSTGEPHEVDHIVPLVGPLVQSRDLGNPIPKRLFFGPLIPVVCGLHCEANMQVLHHVANRRKNNRTWPDMPRFESL